MIVAVFAALAFLFTVGRHVEASCAWVLWSTQLTVSAVTSREDGLLDVDFTIPQHSEPIQSFVSLQKCEETQEWRTGKLLNPKVGMKFFRYTCLPDTIDPRGPKGSGR
jgi:hypothetical protein